MKYQLGLALIVMAMLLPLPCLGEEPDSADHGAGTVQGSSTKEESAGRVRPATPEPVTLTDLAFADASEILSAENSCSSFFGGAR